MNLATDHPYYTSQHNYHCGHYPVIWDNVSDFLFAYNDLDINQNVVYRWDVKKKEDKHLRPSVWNGAYYWAQITIIHQKKGIYAPHIINNVFDEEFPMLEKYLQRHWENIKAMWKPFEEEINEN